MYVCVNVTVTSETGSSCYYFFLNFFFSLFNAFFIVKVHNLVIHMEVSLTNWSFLEAANTLENTRTLVDNMRVVIHTHTHMHIFVHILGSLMRIKS